MLLSHPPILYWHLKKWLSTVCLWTQYSQSSYIVSSLFCWHCPAIKSIYFFALSYFYLCRTSICLCPEQFCVLNGKNTEYPTSNIFLAEATIHWLLTFALTPTPVLNNTTSHPRPVLSSRSAFSAVHYHTMYVQYRTKNNDNNTQRAWFVLDGPTTTPRRDTSTSTYSA
jgi:hypothetical protein